MKNSGSSSIRRTREINTHQPRAHLLLILFGGSEPLWLPEGVARALQVKGTLGRSLMNNSLSIKNYSKVYLKSPFGKSLSI